MNDSPFQAIRSQQTYMVVHGPTGRCLGAFGRNFYRPWVFPLYTPSGQTVIQEFPFDHPFHTGAFVGQNPVLVNGQRANFWAVPPRRSFEDPLFSQVGRMDTPNDPAVVPHAAGVQFSLTAVWRDDEENPILDERRSVDIFAVDDATICDITSEKIATYGTVEYPQTKFGSIGIRVEPRLLPPFGGVVIADDDRCGDAAIVHEQDSRYVAYENSLGEQARFGVALSILQPAVQGPWFIRDYGMAIYNPTWRASISTQKGESWTIALRIVAYDGALTANRVHRWLNEPYLAPRVATASDS